MGSGWLWLGCFGGASGTASLTKPTFARATSHPEQAEASGGKLRLASAPSPPDPRLPAENETAITASAAATTDAVAPASAAVRRKVAGRAAEGTLETRSGSANSARRSKTVMAPASAA